MFPLNLIELLNNWVATDIAIPNAATYRPYPSLIVPGQFNISLNRKISLKFVHEELKVELKKNFQTAGVGSDPEIINPNGDFYRLQKFLNQFDQEFSQKVFDAESDLIERLNPGGFF